MVVQRKKKNPDSKSNRLACSKQAIPNRLTARGDLEATNEMVPRKGKTGTKTTAVTLP